MLAYIAVLSSPSMVAYLDFIGRAGKLAPICMLVVVFVLYLFRWIYAEVSQSMKPTGHHHLVMPCPLPGCLVYCPINL
jgi:hypothetical protein